jgi:serine/threonine protein kinase
MREPPREDLSGRAVLDGRFLLRKRLGAGAFGAVYRATEFAFGTRLREVAIKLTHEQGVTPARAAELLADGFTLARVAAGCPDPEARKHLIQVYEVGITSDLGGRGYAVLEYVPGVLLMDHIRAFGPGVPMATARRYLRDLCRVLLACHRLDPPLMHGDLKPDNVLVDDRQTLRLIDFGLARPVDRLLGYSANTGGCLGYCAPETLVGKGGLGADVYSLGLIMYEVLCGDGPHLHVEPNDGPDASWYYYERKQELKFDPVAGRNQSADQDRHLFRVVERCCRFHLHDRYASVEDLLADLDREPDEAAPAATVGPACDPLDRAVGCFEAHDPRGCLEALAAHSGGGLLPRVLRAICLAETGDHAAALEAGAEPFERAKTDPTIRRDYLARLAAALGTAARARA